MIQQVASYFGNLRTEVWLKPHVLANASHIRKMHK